MDRLVHAFYCSEAVLFDKNEEVEKHLNKFKSDHPNEAQFERVHVSVDSERSNQASVNDQDSVASVVKFLVAYTEDTTLIAFRGGRNLENLNTTRPSPSRADLHKEVRNLAESFLPGSDIKLLQELYRSEKRIIFCGHTLGGSMAQWMVIRFWKENTGTSSTSISKEGTPRSMIALTFGAPNIWDQLMWNEVNADSRLKNHFINVTIREDPLHTILPDGLQGPQNGPVANFGVQLSNSFNGVASDSGSNCVPGMGTGKPWNRKKFRDRYISAVDVVRPKMSPGVLRTSTPSSSSSTAEKITSIEVDSPAPQIKRAIRKESDTEMYITIHGSNLLYLRGPVTLDGLHAWKTNVQSDVLLHISPTENTKPEDIGKGSWIVLKTAFGAVRYSLDEDLAGTPLKLLSKIVQTYYALATPGPFCLLPPKHVLDDLDGIINCVPGLMKDDGESLSAIMLKERPKSCDNVGDMNMLVEGVTEYLNKSYVISYERSYLGIMGCIAGGILLGGGLVLIPFGGIALAAGGIVTIAACMTVVGASASIGGTGIVMLSLDGNKFMLPTYNDMLKFAINEASLWNNANECSKLGVVTNSILESTKLELLLHEQVARSGRNLGEMVKRFNDANTKDHFSTLSKHSKLKRATAECKQNILRRMHIVAKTVDVYANEVKDIEFLGLVGEEDAGKSTFIKKAIKIIRKGDHKTQLPQVGIEYHTTTVTPYLLEGKFYLVDFPGGNSVKKYGDAWKQFTALPSSCILLLHFQGDVKREQVEMYKQMQKDINSKIAVVFNKVDEQFSPRRELVFTADYFDNQRKKAAKEFQCNGEDIHYACLDPDPEDKLVKLKKVGVLGFAELAFKLGEWLNKDSKTNSHKFLMSIMPEPQLDQNMAE